MQTFAKYILLIFSGLLLIMLILDKMYTYTYQNSLPRNKISYLISQKSKHIDYIFIGSSRVDNTINTEVIEKHLGGKSLNLGIQASKPSDYLLIVKLLQELQISSDYIFIQLDHSFNLDTNSDILNSFLVPYMEYTSIQRHLKSTLNDYWYVKNIPFYRYLKYDYQLGFREFFSSAIGKPTKIDFENGFYPKPGYSGVPLNAKLSEKIAPNNKYVDSILALKENKNLNIIFFSSPYCPDTDNIDFIYRLEKKFDTFWNFSEVLPENEYYYDCLHLNEKGANHFSEKIAEEIKNLNRENLIVDPSLDN